MAIGDKNELTLKISADAKQAKQEIASLRSEVVSNVGTIISALPGGEVIGGIINQVTGLSRAVEASLALISKATASAAQAVGTVADATTTATAATEAATVATEAQTVATEASAVATETKAAASQVAATTQTELAVATATATVAEEGATVATVELGVAAVATDVALTPMVATIGALGIGLAAVAIVITAGAVAAFKLAESASEAGSKIHDLSQQTGLGALTLSGWSLAAQQAGKDVDSVGPPMARFNRLIGEANDGSKQAIGTLRQFGIDAKAAANDTDAAFAQAVKRIYEIPPGAQQAAAAQKLFGRSGAELIPVIMQMNGSLAEVKQQAIDLGIAFTQDAANAADEFGDNVVKLEAHLAGLKNTIGNVLIPVFVELFRVVSAESKSGGGFNAFSFALGVLKFNADGARDSLLALIAAAETIPQISAGSHPIEQFLANYSRLQTEAKTPDPTAPTKDDPLDGKGGKDNAKKKAAEEYRIALKAAADAEKDAQVSYQTNTRNNKEELDKQAIDFAKFTEDQKRYEKDLSAAAEARAVAETTAATEAFHKKVLTQAQYNEVNKELLTRRNENTEKFNAIDQKLDDDKDQKQSEAAQRSRDRIYKSQVAADQRLLQEIARFATEGYVTHEEAANRRQAVEENAYERTKALLEAEFNDQETDVERRKDITQTLTDMENDRKNAILDNAREIHAARQQDIDDLERINEEVEAARKKGDDQREADRIARELNDPTSGRSLFGDDFADALDMGASKLEAFAKMAQGIFHQLSASAGNFGTMLKDIFNGIGQAVGNVVRNFVLLGNTGTSFRKFAAEVIASVAQMAAVKAVFELAEGLAMLALTYFTGNPIYAASAGEHFAAAAMYGTIAGVAAIAGRVVAGNAFQDQASGSGAGAGSGSSGPGSTGSTSTGSETAQTITQNRNQPQQHVVTIKLQPGLMGEHLEQDVNNNGKSRAVIMKLIEA